MYLTKIPYIIAIMRLCNTHWISIIHAHIVTMTNPMTNPIRLMGCVTSSYFMPLSTSQHQHPHHSHIYPHLSTRVNHEELVCHSSLVGHFQGEDSNKMTPGLTLQELQQAITQWRSCMVLLSSWEEGPKMNQMVFGCFFDWLMV